MSAQGNRKQITIRFPSAEGIAPGRTSIRHRGVEVGVVTGLSLSDGMQSAVVEAELFERYNTLATEQSLFWIVRPEIDLSGLRGLDAVTSGTYIAVRVAGGQESSSFDGLRSRPNRPEFGPGLDLVLNSSSSNNVTVGSPVFYKQVVVGRVSAVDVSRDGSGVQIFVNIETRYAPLVRRDSVFWSVGGLRVAAGLADFELDFETIETVLRGGLAFATPTQPADSQPVLDGTAFTVEARSDPRWLEWAPEINLGTRY